MLQQDLRVQPSSLSRLPMRSCLLFASSSVEHVERCWRVLCKCHLQHRARHPHYRSNHSSTVKQTLVVHLMKLTAPQKNLYVTNTFLFSSTPDSPLPLCSRASVSSGNGLNLLCLSQDSQVGDSWKVVPTAHFLSLFPAMLFRLENGVLLTGRQLDWCVGETGRWLFMEVFCLRLRIQRSSACGVCQSASGISA